MEKVYEDNSSSVCELVAVSNEITSDCTATPSIVAITSTGTGGGSAATGECVWQADSNSKLKINDEKKRITEDNKCVLRGDEGDYFFRRSADNRFISLNNNWPLDQNRVFHHRLDPLLFRHLFPFKFLLVDFFFFAN